jgi:membrane protease YdiL (CAAX protease family)
MDNELRVIWRKFFRFDWKLGLFLTGLVCIPRFYLVLRANETANYSLIGIVMTVSALIPFLILNKQGLKSIGLTRPKRFSWITYGFLLGLASSILLLYVGKQLYGNSMQNWYIYIAKSYNIPADILSNDKMILFAVMAVTGMLFSPIGEELFFRGIVHESFSNTLGAQKASLIDSTAFAITHLSHFGLVFLNGKWTLFPVPAILWVVSMFLVSLLFYYCRKKSGSILGAIVCHAAFNLGMIFCIFYLL